VEYLINEAYPAKITKLPWTMAAMLQKILLKGGAGSFASN